MATIGQKAYTQALATALTTELNTLATNAGSAASAAIDNSTNLDLFMDVQIGVTFGTNPTVGTTLDLYLLPSVDGTNYADYVSGASAAPAKAMLVGGFELRAVTTAQLVMLTGIPIPKYFKIAIVNNATGQSTAASGNTVKYRTYSMQSV